jgi:acid phosphatase (class A)
MKLFFRWAFVLNAFALSAWADDVKPVPWSMPALDFFIERVSPPPQPGSAADQADLDFSMAVQADANPDVIREATIAAVYFNVFSYAEVLGPKFTATNYPLTAAFFKRLEVTANDPKNKLKDHFARPRPVDGRKDQVKQLVPYESGYSYPSGHATRAWLYALVLGQLDSGDRLAFLREAARVGFLRVIGGMHYQSDVIASRTLAEILYAQLMADPEFGKDLAALKAAEWASPPPLEAKPAK